MSHNPKLDLDPARHKRLKIAAATVGTSLKELGGCFIDNGLADLEAGRLNIKGRPVPQSEGETGEEES